jgi:hypothetical protein
MAVTIGSARDDPDTPHQQLTATQLAISYRVGLQENSTLKRNKLIAAVVNGGGDVRQEAE